MVKVKDSCETIQECNLFSEKMARHKSEYITCKKNLSKWQDNCDHDVAAYIGIVPGEHKVGVIERYACVSCGKTFDILLEDEGYEFNDSLIKLSDGDIIEGYERFKELRLEIVEYSQQNPNVSIQNAVQDIMSNNSKLTLKSKK